MGNQDLLSVSLGSCNFSPISGQALVYWSAAYYKGYFGACCKVGYIMPSTATIARSFLQVGCNTLLSPELTTHLYLDFTRSVWVSVPDWWPAVSNQDNQNALLWTTLITIDHQTAADAWLVCDVLHVAVRDSQHFRNFAQDRRGVG